MTTTLAQAATGTVPATEARPPGSEVILVAFIMLVVGYLALLLWAKLTDHDVHR